MNNRDMINRQALLLMTDIEIIRGLRNAIEDGLQSTSAKTQRIVNVHEFKHGTTFYINWMVDGKPVRKNIGFCVDTIRMMGFPENFVRDCIREFDASIASTEKINDK